MSGESTSRKGLTFLQGSSDDFTLVKGMVKRCFQDREQPVGGRPAGPHGVGIALVKRSGRGFRRTLAGSAPLLGRRETVVPVADPLSGEFRKLDLSEVRQNTGFRSIPVSAHALEPRFSRAAR